MERVSKIEIQLCCREISLREIFGSWYTACPSPGWERGMQQRQYRRWRRTEGHTFGGGKSEVGRRGPDIDGRQANRDEKRNSASLSLFPRQENHNKSIDGTPVWLLGIERIPGYLTSIVRIRVATAIVNTILNSIENLSPRLKRRPATEEDVRHGRSGPGMGVDKVRDISKSYFCFSRGSFRLIRSRNFRPVLGSIPISLLSFLLSYPR